jgi:Tfp pilus assembly protein PilE
MRAGIALIELLIAIVVAAMVAAMSVAALFGYLTR